MQVRLNVGVGDKREISCPREKKKQGTIRKIFLAATAATAATTLTAATAAAAAAATTVETVVVSLQRFISRRRPVLQRSSLCFWKRANVYDVQRRTDVFLCSYVQYGDDPYLVTCGLVDVDAGLRNLQLNE